MLYPFQGFTNVTPPQPRASTSSQRLPSIAEDENTRPLSSRRDGAPQSIDIPTITNYSFDRRSSVQFAEDTPSSVKVEEIPAVSPAGTARSLSPAPPNYRMEAGNTPLRATRAVTPPPNNSLSIAEVEDAPTRNNTYLNTYVARSNDEESDKELKGPLNMPSLPNAPGAGNFTFDALSRRLEQIERQPETPEARPGVFMQPSPGLASPADDQNLSPRTGDA